MSLHTETAPPIAAPWGCAYDLGELTLQAHISGPRHAQITAVIVAGLGCPGAFYYRLHSHLSKRYRVLSYDRCGLGSSPQADDPADAQTAAWHLARLLRAANVRGPVVLLGHSMGGAIIRIFADLFPQQVLGLVFLDATVPGIMQAIAFDRGESERHFAAMKRQAERGEMPKAFATFEGELADVLDARQILRSAVMRAAHYDACIKESRAVDLGLSQAARVTTLGDLPIRVLSAAAFDNDSIKNDIRLQPAKYRRICREYQQQLPGLSSCSQHVEVNGAGHNTLVLRQEHVALIAQHVDELVQVAYQRQLAAWERGRYGPPPSPPASPCEPTLTERVPMRDAVRLHTDVFLPDGRGPYPVILLRSPYPFAAPAISDDGRINRYVQAGYGVVSQLMRGQGDSEGVFRYHVDEVQDGYDCIDWIASQSWCDGAIGMEGPSYLGYAQLAAARSRHKALKCIMPTAFVGHAFAIFPYLGGIFTRGQLLQWHKLADSRSRAELDFCYGEMSVLDHPVWGPALRKRPLIAAADGILSGDKLASWRDMVSRHVFDEHWRSLTFTDAELAELDLPMFFTDGWHDLTVGPIDFFERLERTARPRHDRYLLVGPWNHLQTYAAHLQHQNNGERITPPNAAVDLIAQRLAFYDRHLRGNTKAVLQKQRVRVYITGPNEWRDYSTFPVPGTDFRPMYLHSEGDARSIPGDGRLDWTHPAHEPADQYVYDPDSPTPYQHGQFRDRREIEIRCDVLTYTSEPLRAPLTLLGNVKLMLHAASDAPDTDWFAALTEVFPDGRSVPFHGVIGALRARFRRGFDREVLLVPHQPEVFELFLGPVGHQIPAGHRLRVSIFSAAFPFCDANTNTGQAPATDTDSRIARQTIFHDLSRPSHLLLPIVDH